LFVGAGVALFAYAFSARGWMRLLALVSPPFLFSIQTANWPPLIASAALLPGLGWLVATKPNLGLVALAHAPRRATILGAIAFAVLAVVIAPTWPMGWIEHLRRQPVSHLPALAWPAGFVGLLGLLRWRTPEGRALAAMTVVPTASLPYDWVMILLCARTSRDTVALTAALWAGWLLLLMTAPNRLDIAWTRGHLLLSLAWLIPAAAIVLRHPNRGDVPAAVERATRWLPRGIRGVPETSADVSSA
jgi:hypothetical protein